MKVTVLGASLLLKTCPLIQELALYDIVNCPGIATDLSHINTKTNCTAHTPDDPRGLENALSHADVVLIAAGIPRKPGMTRDDLFQINADIVRNLVENIARYSADAAILVITNPVNSIVPIVVETLKSIGIFNAKKIFGVTTLDQVRASRFVCDLKKSLDPANVKIPIIGGHSGTTIVPLFSQATPTLELSAQELEKLIHRVQFGGDEVLKAKAGNGTATLSMAYAAYTFAEKIIKAIAIDQPFETEAFVYLPALMGGSNVNKSLQTEYFSCPITVQAKGISRVSFNFDLSLDEKNMLKIALPLLEVDINKGKDYAKKSLSKI